MLLLFWRQAGTVEPPVTTTTGGAKPSKPWRVPGDVRFLEPVEGLWDAVEKVSVAWRGSGRSVIRSKTRIIYGARVFGAGVSRVEPIGEMLGGVLESGGIRSGIVSRSVPSFGVSVASGKMKSAMWKGLGRSRVASGVVMRTEQDESDVVAAIVAALEAM